MAMAVALVVAISAPQTPEVIRVRILEGVPPLGLIRRVLPPHNAIDSVVQYGHHALPSLSYLIFVPHALLLRFRPPLSRHNACLAVFFYPGPIIFDEQID